MCNISSLYLNRGEEKGTFNTNKKVVMNLYKKKHSLEDIAETVELSVEEVEKIIKENS